MKRRSFTALDKLKVTIRQAVCPLCGGILGSIEETDFDHEHALALGGADTIKNLRAVHKDCHAVKTRGTGATTAGSDVGAAAKLKRIEKDPPGGEEFRRRLLATKAGEEVKPARRPKQKIKTRKNPWPPGRTFPKRSKP